VRFVNTQTVQQENSPAASETPHPPSPHANSSPPQSPAHEVGPVLPQASEGSVSSIALGIKVYIVHLGRSIIWFPVTAMLLLRRLANQITRLNIIPAQIPQCPDIAFQAAWDWGGDELVEPTVEVALQS
jgi:hypothetical protein